MKILLCTSIFPPEIAEPAPYIKKIAKQLSPEHKVTVLCYANEVEKVENVNIVNIKKQNIIVKRIVAFFMNIFKIAKNTDIIYVQNSIASSLPATIIAKLLKIPIILRYQEDEVWERAVKLNLTDTALDSFLIKNNLPFKLTAILKIQKIILKFATKVITPSHYLKNILVNRYHINPDKILVLNNPLESTQKLPFDNAVNTKQVFIYIDEKELNSYQDLLNNIKGLINESPNINFVINNHFSRAELEYYFSGSIATIYLSKNNYKTNLLQSCLTLSNYVLLDKDSVIKECIKDSANGRLLDTKANIAHIAKIISSIRTNNVRTEIISWEKHIKILTKIFNDNRKP